ncbi:MAG: hypothetical protein RMJ98_14235 [Myxococcales bacterium]|nr:hypothetical protein [Myxococcales bacterium]
MSIPLRLDTPATHVETAPGGEIILRGSFHSKLDGSVIDAATTTWPKENPGGASIDAGGLVDFQAGGFHVTSRDAQTHEVHAVATGDPAPACAALGVASPCLPLRLREPAHKRLLTQDEWVRSLKGGITLEVLSPPVYAPVVAASRPYVPFLVAVIALAVVLWSLVVFWRVRQRRASSPQGQLLALARRVHAKARGADPVLAAPLVPALAGALRKLEKGALDPTSPEGEKVRVMLEKVEHRLEEESRKARSQQEREITDELAREVEIAFQAAEEALQSGRS